MFINNDIYKFAFMNVHLNNSKVHPTSFVFAWSLSQICRALRPSLKLFCDDPLLHYSIRFLRRYSKVIDVIVTLGIKTF